MGNYLRMADVRKIEALLELCWSHRRIAREVGCGRETVARYARLRESKPANLIAGSSELQNRPNPITGSELKRGVGSSPGPGSLAAPYHDLIQAGVNRGLTAQRIWQDLVEEHGYAHGYLTVQRYVRRVGPPGGRAAGVLIHPPGEEAQCDYFRSPAPVLDPLSGKWKRPWVFRMTLSCSRHGYEEALWGQDRVAFMRSHEHAFAAFGGVPKVIRHDNLGAAVVRACLYDPDVSEIYAAFAQYWGFVPFPSRPKSPQEQGVEERAGGYVKSNALRGRRFDDLAALNAHLQKWNRTIAQLRIHGTTRKQVLAYFLEVEKPALQPLPKDVFEIFEVGNRTVHQDGFVEVDGQFYEVSPHLIGTLVRVRWDEHLVRIYQQGRELRVHVRRRGARGFWPEPGLVAEPRPARQEAFQQSLLARAERVGSQTHAYALACLEARGVRAYRLLQGVLALTRQHPKEVVEWACGVALKSGAFRYRTLRRLVETAASRVARPQRRLTQEDELIRPLTEYAQAMLPGLEPARLEVIS